MKLTTLTNRFETDDAAAFGRLCVETGGLHLGMTQDEVAATFGRLCVETIQVLRRFHAPCQQLPSDEYIFCLYEK